MAAKSWNKGSDQTLIQVEKIVLMLKDGWTTVGRKPRYSDRNWAVPRSSRAAEKCVGRCHAQPSYG